MGFYKDNNEERQYIEIMALHTSSRLSYWQRILHSIVYLYRLFITPKQYVNMVIHGELLSPISSKYNELD